MNLQYVTEMTISLFIALDSAGLTRMQICAIGAFINSHKNPKAVYFKETYGDFEKAESVAGCFGGMLNLYEEITRESEKQFGFESRRITW